MSVNRCSKSGISTVDILIAYTILYRLGNRIDISICIFINTLFEAF